MNHDNHWLPWIAFVLALVTGSAPLILGFSLGLY
jgi:hypothetical protein